MKKNNRLPSRQLFKTKLVEKNEEKQQASQPPALQNETTTGFKHLPGIAVCAMRSALCRQRAIRDTQVEREACWHLSIVVQLSKIHGKEEGSKLDAMVQQFVLQLPQPRPETSNGETRFIGSQTKTNHQSKGSGCRSAMHHNSQSKSAAARPGRRSFLPSFDKYPQSPITCLCM